MTPIAKNPQGAAEEAIALVASTPARHVDPRGFDEVVARAALRPARDRRLIPAFAIAVLAGALVVLAMPRARPAPVVEVVAFAGAHWSRGGNEVTLDSGRLSVRCADGGRVRVVTPQVTLEASQARFLAESISTGTSLVVEAGEVVLRAAGVTRVVKAGESVVWPPAPEIPTALLETSGMPSMRCSEVAESERQGCLQTEAQGSTLDAQAALFELGTLEALDESLQRFPDGVLHPEVRLRRIVLLVKARRFDEARAATRDFEQACPDDPRLPEVRSFRAALK